MAWEGIIEHWFYKKLKLPAISLVCNLGVIESWYFVTPCCKFCDYFSFVRVLLPILLITELLVIAYPTQPQFNWDCSLVEKNSTFNDLFAAQVSKAGFQYY